MSCVENDTYSLGNGKICGFFKDGSILELFGPVYSTPGMFSLELGDSFEAQIERADESAVYKTILKDNDGSKAEISDCVHPEIPLFIRKIEAEAPVTFDIKSNYIKSISENVIKIYTPKNSQVFAKCLTDRDFKATIHFSGNFEICIENGENSNERKISVICKKGETVIRFIACDELDPEMTAISFEAIAKADKEKWTKFFGASDVHKKLSKISPMMKQISESVAIAIKTQTGEQGGVIAGKFYHLAYGRDMFGSFEYYLNMGFLDDARKVIEFFVGEFRKKGRLPNADGIGVLASHNHENDEVEQTGYYLIEIAEYYEKTKDLTIISDNLDYIDHLAKAQEKHLLRAAIPFNGDETYIAGGMLPRTCIDHGSMEATALYIMSINKILKIAAEVSVFPPKWSDERKEKLALAETHFCENFVKDGRVYANTPLRLSKEDFETVLPQKRHGVCNHCGAFDWIYRTPGGSFVCGGCKDKFDVKISEERFSVDPAVYMPLFLGFNMIPEEITIASIERSLKMLLSEERKQIMTVGYELGLLLKLASDRGFKAEADEIFERLTARCGRFGGWVEYYTGDEPSGRACPARPWEGAINMLGILAYFRDRI